MDTDPFDELRRELRGEVADDASAGRRLAPQHVLGGVAVAVVLGVAIVVIAAGRPTSDPEPAAAPGPSLQVVEEPPSSAPTTAARVWPAEPVEVAGNEVRRGGHRWQVGAPGDLVAIGDWDCDGSATPAVLRAATGRLHLFDSWATADATVAATPGPAVPPDASAFEASGCGHASVRTADGQTVGLSTTGIAAP